MRCFAFLILALLQTNVSLHAADWPGWRGPEGLGVSSEKSLPTHWAATNNIAWQTSLPGSGASSPSVVGERVYLTTQTTNSGLQVLALNRKTGETLWDSEVERGRRPSNKIHNMATPTPVSDGEFIWAMFGTGDVACLDRNGKIVWHRNLISEYGEFKYGHGFGSSPMLHDGKLFIAVMHQGPSYVLALDARTGTNLWKMERNIGSKDESQDSYSSPIFVTANGRKQLVVAGAEHLNAYNPITGAELWIHGGIKTPLQFGRTIAGPTAATGLIVTVGSGFQNRGYTFALPADGKGVVPESNRLWTCAKFSPDCSSPVIFNDLVFFIRDDGIASCLDLKTGEPYWQERVFSANVKISPVAADGKVYFLNGQGNCVVLAASKKMETLATNTLNQATLSSPAISQGQLFIRTESSLYCVGKSQ